jgi:hypothetical protein
MEFDVPRYLVEAYVPRSQVQEAEAAGHRARAAAEQLSREGTAVRHVRTTFLPDDEMCFHVFDYGVGGDRPRGLPASGLGSPRIAPAVECGSE